MPPDLRVEQTGDDTWRFVFPSDAKAEEPELERAVRLMDEGERHQAFFVLRELVVRCPALIEAHNKIAEFHTQRGNFESAFQALSQAVSAGREALPEAFQGMLPWEESSNRPFLTALHGLAHVCLALGKKEEGEELLRRLLELDPADNLGAGQAIAELAS